MLAPNDVLHFSVRVYAERDAWFVSNIGDIYYPGYMFCVSCFAAACNRKQICTKQNTKSGNLSFIICIDRAILLFCIDRVPQLGTMTPNKSANKLVFYGMIRWCLNRFDCPCPSGRRFTFCVSSNRFWAHKIVPYHNLEPMGQV